MFKILNILFVFVFIYSGCRGYLESRVINKYCLARSRMLTIATSLESYRLKKGKLPFTKRDGYLDIDFSQNLELKFVYSYQPKFNIQLHSFPKYFPPQLINDPFTEGASFYYYNNGVRYLLISVGPDKRLDLSAQEVFDQNGELRFDIPLITYDPSNGTLSSAGDIILDSRKLENINCFLYRWR